MKNGEFDIIIEEWLEKLRNNLIKKGREYAREDRLSNFKQAAAAMRETPEKALRGMWIKHVVSICDFIDDLDTGLRWSPAMWDEKIMDAITYMLLLAAMRDEARKDGRI